MSYDILIIGNNYCYRGYIVFLNYTQKQNFTDQQLAKGPSVDPNPRQVCFVNVDSTRNIYVCMQYTNYAHLFSMGHGCVGHAYMGSISHVFFMLMCGSLT